MLSIDKEIIQDIMGTTERFQKECHDMVEEILIETKTIESGSVQDATNVWLFKKLAEFNNRLSQIEHFISSNLKTQTP